MDAFCTNDAEVRVSACEFPVAGHRETVNATERWVLTAGDRKISTIGSRDTASLDICGQVTVVEWMSLRLIFDVFDRDTGYE